VVVETTAGEQVVKLRGAAQGLASLVAEVLVAAIADRLHLPVPPRRLITLSPDTPTDDRNDELADLLRASIGENLGFRFLPAARPLHGGELSRVPRDFASQVRWLDWLVLNPDRRPENPNILVDGPRFWLIDHGAALPFHHDWSTVTEATPLRREFTFPHAFSAMANDLVAWDPLLTALLTRESLAGAVAEVPDSFLLPLLPPGSTTAVLQRRRAAYQAFLWKRLQGPRDFARRE
jgi:hypothetical protein